MGVGQGETAWLAQITTVVVIALLVGGTAPWWWTELFGGKAPRPASPTPPPAAVKYVVTERNPFSGGVENARVRAGRPACLHASLHGAPQGALGQLALRRH